MPLGKAIACISQSVIKRFREDAKISVDCRIWDSFRKRKRKKKKNLFFSVSKTHTTIYV